VLVGEIAKAERELLVQAYNFTEPRIIAAIIAAHRRGVLVTVILDKISPGQKGEGADPVHDAGIPTFIGRKPKIAHNKVAVIDQTTVVTGSFNFSTNAGCCNAENLRPPAGARHRLRGELRSATCGQRRVCQQSVDSRSRYRTIERATIVTPSQGCKEAGEPGVRAVGEANADLGECRGKLAVKNSHENRTASTAGTVARCYEAAIAGREKPWIDREGVGTSHRRRPSTSVGGRGGGDGSVSSECHPARFRLVDAADAEVSAL
jgi:hypothetical protein